MQAALLGWVSRRVRNMKSDRLERSMRGAQRRRLALWVIFKAMPRSVSRKTLEREQVVIEWHIVGRDDGLEDVRQLVIEEGSASVVTGEPREPDLAITMDGATLIRLATGNADASALFVRGELQVNGSPWLAMRLPGFFAVGSRQAT